MLPLETTEARLSKLENVGQESCRLEIFYQEVGKRLGLVSLTSVLLLASPHFLFLSDHPDLVSRLHVNCTREECPQEVSPGLVVWLVWECEHPTSLGLTWKLQCSGLPWLRGTK